MIESSTKKEGWPECFQDLGSWCPPPPDELHTPKVILQDEFNFSNDGHVNEWDFLSSPVDLQCDPLGNDTPFGISFCQSDFGELNSSSFVQERTPVGVISQQKVKTNNLESGGGKQFTTETNNNNRSPLKLKGNVLLSQGIVKSASEENSLLSMTVFDDKAKNDSVLIDNNNCYLLPLTMPEYASNKLNSSSSVTTPPLQSLTQSATTTILLTPTVRKGSPVRGNPLLANTSQQDNVQHNVKNVYIKEEDPGIDENFRMPTVVDSTDYRATMEMQPSRRQKPRLKLNIAAANIAAKTSTNSLDTPEVLRPLVDEDNRGFNLLRYVCNDTEFPGLSQGVEEEEEVDDNNNDEDEEDDNDLTIGDQSVRDHDYVDPWTTGEAKPSIVIKSEPPPSPASTSGSTTKQGRSSFKGQSKKRQHDDSSDCAVSESDFSITDEDDDSLLEWIPKQLIKKRRRKVSVNSAVKDKKEKKPAVRSRRRSSNTSQMTSISVGVGGGEGGGEDKYRALRERNNEASRRSRMNRKQRDEEMIHTAEELHNKNVYLKARAEKMENLVKYMRAEIMKAFSKGK